MSKKSTPVQVAELFTENTQLRERHHDALNQIRPLERQVGNLLHEIAELRQKLSDEKVKNAELRGYLKALKDQKPPQMIPEPQRYYSDSLIYDPLTGSDVELPF